jgi:hypothetical protein
VYLVCLKVFPGVETQSYEQAGVKEVKYPCSWPALPGLNLSPMSAASWKKDCQSHLSATELLQLIIGGCAGFGNI